MRKFTGFLLVALFLITGSVKADEGMWLLPYLKKFNIEVMQEKGLELTAEEIYSVNSSSLKDAIVIFGGGCTGELISDQGLILTNHHCGYGAIQYHSSVEHDYLKDGFWAMSREEELNTPNLSATFLVKLDDVTEKVMAKVKSKMTEDERAEVINEAAEAIEKEATEGNHYRARVQSYYGGNQYFLLVYEVFTDVRMVGAPPSSIGKYGADTDNWMWPRHTGDFSIFRVYAGPDGKPADYSPDNVPLKPKHHLPVSLKGVEKGDFTMVMGYPGGTQRYMTSFEVEEVLNITHPNRIKIRGQRQEIMMEDMLADDDVRIKYSSKYARSSNYWKFSIGQSKGLKRLKIVDKKEAQQEEFKKWAAADKKRQAEYGDALTLIEDATNGRAPYLNARQYISECLTRGTELIGFAGSFSTIYDKLEEGASNEEIMKSTSWIKRRVESFYKDYNQPTDHKVAQAMFKLFMEDVDKQYQPTVFETIKNEYKGDVNAFVDKMFETSMFTSKEKVEAFLENPTLEAIKGDMALMAAKSIMEKSDELRDKAAEYDDKFTKGHRLYVAALLKMNEGKPHYPDANFTMRLTYGEVGDYSPADAVIYKHYTTIEGIMEKEDPDNWEFVVPEKLKELYKNKDYGIYGEDGTLPVCFTSNNDITGGNSGSPVINGKGHLIGCAFDGNWEAMSGDIAFEHELQKCINVDIRYVLFIVDKYAGAGHLIDEMTIIK